MSIFSMTTGSSMQAITFRKTGVFIKSDERILGRSDFVNDVLAGVQEALDAKYALVAKGIGWTHVVEALSELMAIAPHDLIGPRKERTIVKSRALMCYWVSADLGMSMTEIGNRLNIFCFDS
jgi:putative transposase